MDNHPIPQDVSHFQFKLVGQLTIKQFGYLIAGGILTLIMLSLPINILLKTPLVLITAGSGLLFAFIPIEGRPADLMVSYFFRALFEPNQYIYSKQGVTLPYFQQTPLTNAPVPTQEDTSITKPSPQFSSPLQKDTLLHMQLSQSDKNDIPLIQSTNQRVSNLLNTSQSTMAPPTGIVNIPSVTPPPAVQTPKEDIQAQTSDQSTPQQTQPETTSQPQAKNPPPAAHDTILEQQLQQTLAEKEQLKKQLEQMQQQMATTPVRTQQTPPGQPSTPVKTAVASPPIAKKIVPQPNTKSSLIAPDFPNIVMGVVKDARGNVLPNILIEVKDSNNNPVRAFKTNALGQFASATPLLNGTYTITFEDSTKTHTFDIIEIVAKGEIMQPIEIISLDKREELRKELFG